LCGENVLSVTLRNWIEVRELPGDEKAEVSYVRHQDIERVFFVENSPNEIHVFISALGEKFLYNTVETMREAELNSKGLIDDIERSKIR
jgi:hypothetical protein